MISLRALVVGFLVVVSACGEGDSTPVADGGADTPPASSDLQYSCDYTKDGVHLLCTETGYPAELAEIIGMAMDQCGAATEPNAVETLGDTCPLGDAVGGCRTVDAGAPGVTVTVWSYTGTAAQAEAGCMPGATFVTP